MSSVSTTARPRMTPNTALPVSSSSKRGTAIAEPGQASTRHRATARARKNAPARSGATSREENARRINNRIVVIVRPRAPFIDWINSSDPDAPEIPLDYACAEPNIFLLPATEAADVTPLSDAWERDFDRVSTSSAQIAQRIAGDDWLLQHWPTLFQRSLEDWDVASEDCPQPQSLALFLAWFDVHTHTAVFDYADEPLRYHLTAAQPETQPA